MGTILGLENRLIPTVHSDRACRRATDWPQGYGARVSPVADVIDALADANGFAGVVAVDRGGEVLIAKAYGLAHRAHRIPNTMDTRFGIASGVKGITALAVISLVESGAVDLATTARSVLGGDLPLIDDAVTIEHLLAHRS